MVLVPFLLDLEQRANANTSIVIPKVNLMSKAEYLSKCKNNLNIVIKLPLKADSYHLVVRIIIT